MPRDFKLKGTQEEKLAQLEQVIPRILAKHSRRRVTIPPSVISKDLDDLSKPFKCLLFAGEIKKLAYSFSSVTKDDKPVEFHLECSLFSNTKNQSMSYKAKKLSGIFTLNLKVEDGDVLMIRSGDSSISYSGALFSLLLVPEFSLNTGEDNA